MNSAKILMQHPASKGNTSSSFNWLGLIMSMMNCAQTYVNICVPEIQVQWKYGYVLVDQGNIFHIVKVVREEEWYLWSAKHCGILWETIYIFSLSENILIFTLAIPVLGIFKPKAFISPLTRYKAFARLLKEMLSEMAICKEEKVSALAYHEL